VLAELAATIGATMMASEMVVEKPHLHFAIDHKPIVRQSTASLNLFFQQHCNTVILML